MKIIAAAAICAHLWRSDALPSDSEPSNLRGGKARELVQACATTPRYYPNTSGGWDGGFCEYSLNCNIPGYDTGKDCCESVYPDQSTFFCTCKRTDLDDDMQAACAATLGLDTPAEEGTPDAAPAPAPDAENSSNESVSSNSDYNTGYNKWSPVLLGPGLPADLLEQCFAHSSMPNAHPCNALETVAALHHDSHGDADLVKSAFDEFLTKTKEAGDPCQPAVDSSGALSECPSDHYCQPIDETGASGLCEACPADLDNCADFESELGGHEICYDKCGRAPRGQCFNPLEVNFFSTCPLGTYCPATESEIEQDSTAMRRLRHLDALESSARDCTVCPSPSQSINNDIITDICQSDAADAINGGGEWDESDTEACIAKLVMQTTCEELFDDDWNFKACIYFCYESIEKVKNMVGTIAVLANRQSGGGEPGNDMMLLEYNFETKKATHHEDKTFLSIDEMDGDLGVDDYGFVEASRHTSSYKANPNWQGGAEVRFSENMIMYCCFNEQFQGDLA